MNARAVWLGAAALCLAACGDADMYAQHKSATWDGSPFLPQKTSMQPPVPGTVPRDEPNQPVPPPQTITAALIERGHERYNIFCTPCHGLTGAGDGMIVQRGFPRPPSFTSDRLMNAKAQLVYDTITNGKGNMYSYAERVPPGDRWAIVAYIRALQLSQRPVLASLPAEDRAKLDATVTASGAVPK